jgi:hypothetical protein
MTARLEAHGRSPYEHDAVTRGNRDVAGGQGRAVAAEHPLRRRGRRRAAVRDGDVQLWRGSGMGRVGDEADRRRNEIGLPERATKPQPIIGLRSGQRVGAREPRRTLPQAVGGEDEASLGPIEHRLDGRRKSARLVAFERESTDQGRPQAQLLERLACRCDRLAGGCVGALGKVLRREVRSRQGARHGAVDEAVEIQVEEPDFDAGAGARELPQQRRQNVGKPRFLIRRQRWNRPPVAPGDRSRVLRQARIASARTSVIVHEAPRVDLEIHVETTDPRQPLDHLPRPVMERTPPEQRIERASHLRLDTAAPRVTARGGQAAQSRRRLQ